MNPMKNTYNPIDCNKEKLEELIDTFSVSEILRLMSEICDEKADHILTSWQDEPLADWWSKTSNDLEILAEKAE